MECAFECSFEYDGNGPQGGKKGLRKARKSHKCCECRGEIKPGEQYRYESGIWDGEPASFKICLDCLDLRNEFCGQGFTYGEVHNMIREAISDADGDVPVDGLGALRPGARAALFEILEGYWQEQDEENPLRVALRLDARRRFIHPRHEKFRYLGWVVDRLRDVKRITDACFDAIPTPQAVQA